MEFGDGLKGDVRRFVERRDTVIFFFGMRPPVYSIYERAQSARGHRMP